MPQPHKVTPRETITFGVDVILQREELAKEIALVASHWNELELTLSEMFSALLLAREPAAFDIYHEIKDIQLRKTIFVAAARSLLPDGLTTKIIDLYEDLRDVAGERARIVHGVWAITDRKRRQNTLLLCEQKALNLKFSEHLDNMRSSLTIAIVKATARNEPEPDISAIFADATERLDQIPTQRPLTGLTAYWARDFKFTRDRIDGLQNRAELLCREILRVTLGQVLQSDALDLNSIAEIVRPMMKRGGPHARSADGETLQVSPRRRGE